MLITERYQKQIVGVISCYDRVIIQGSLSQWGYAEGMTSFLVNNNIRILDYKLFAQKLRDNLKNNIEAIAKDGNIEIEYVRKPSAFSYEQNVQKTISEKNIKQGLVKIFSVQESCFYYQPKFDPATNRASVKTRPGVCLHYYVYFIDKQFGLCFLRIPTYAPFRLQFYFNGHNALANKLKKEDIKYKLYDNAFFNIEDFKIAQDLSDNFRSEDLHQFLNILADKYLTFLKGYNQQFRWTIMQAEYSTDIIFKDQSDFQIFYQDLIYKVTLSVKPDNISTFLGKKLSPNFQGEIGNNFNFNRILGTRIKHRKDVNYIKIYDKFGIILRIETTVNSVTDFNHFRTIDKKDGSQVQAYAKMKKNIYSLYALAQLLEKSNHRYLEFISAFDDNSKGHKHLLNLSEPVIDNDHSLKGFNFFSKTDLNLLLTISRGEFLINGFRNKDLRKYLQNLSTFSISRILKRLVVHHILKRVHKTYKYYPTKLGKSILSSALMLKEFFLIPNLSNI